MRALAAAAGLVAAAALGTPWACQQQPGPFSMWVNEIHYMAEQANRKVEVAAVTAAGINYNNIDILLVDAAGNTLALRNLGSSCVMTHTDASVPPIDLWVCADWGPATPVATTGGGAVLVNNRGNFDPADDIIIQFLAIGVVGPYRGVAACQVPPDQNEHMFSPGDVSIQLVNGGTFDAARNAVDIYQFSWQGLIPATFGQLNQGQSQWGGFVQLFPPGALPDFPGGGGAAPGQNPATVDNDKGALGACTLGPMTAFSVCSYSCTPATAAAAAQGTQIQYKPVVVFPADGDVTKCTPLAQRSVSKACTSAAQCTTCQDAVKDGTESDVDCGGGSVSSPLPVTATIDDWFKYAQRQYANSFASARLLQASSSTCSRCTAGRTCNNHTDCATSAGLLCALGTCTPYFFLNETVFVDFSVGIAGMDALELNALPVMNTLQLAIADTITAGGVNTSAAGVSLTKVTFTAGGKRQLLELGAGAADGAVSMAVDADGSSGDGTVVLAADIKHHLNRAAINAAKARQLAIAADQLQVTVRVAARSQAIADRIVAAVRTKNLLMQGMVQERVRIYAPLIGQVTVGAATVVSAPYKAIGLTPGIGVTPNPTGGGDGGLSTGAIIGIVVGVLAGLVLFAVTGLFVRRFVSREEKPHVRRAGIDIGETRPAPDPAAAALAAGLAGAHTKALFAPEHPHRHSQSAVGPDAAAMVSQAAALAGVKVDKADLSAPRSDGSGAGAASVAGSAVSDVITPRSSASASRTPGLAVRRRSQDGASMPTGSPAPAAAIAPVVVNVNAAPTTPSSAVRPVMVSP